MKETNKSFFQFISKRNRIPQEMARPKRQTAKKIDYTQFIDPEAAQDDADFSDNDVTMDDFKGVEDEDDEDGAFQEDDQEDENENQEEPDAEIANEEILIVEEITKKAKKSTNSALSKKPKVKSEPAKRGRKPKVIVPNAPKLPKDPGEKSEFLTLKSITNYKDKVTRMFGFNKDKLIELIEYRKLWENNMFSAPAEQSIEVNFGDKELPPLLEEADATEYTVIDEKTYYETFRTISEDEIKEVQFNNNGEYTVKLKTGKTTLSGDGKILLNCGCNITDLLFVATEDKKSEDMYLIVAITDDFAKTQSPPPSSFFKTSNYTSGFQIYHMNGLTKELRLIRCITHNFGNSWDLKVISVIKGKVLISGMFNDMSVKFVEIPTDTSNIDVEYLQMDSASLEVSLYDEVITCYDISSDFSLIILGTNTGNVVKINLNVSVNVPIGSYYITNSLIFSLSIGESKYDETLVFGTSANGTNFAFNLTNFTNSINILSRSKGTSLKTKYMPSVYSFILLDAQHPARMLAARALFLQYNLAKHEGSIESIAISPHHPMYLTGGSDGCVKIASGLRRMMCGPKGNYHRILTLTRFEYHSEEDIYRLTRPMNVEKLGALDSANNLPIYQREIGIVAMSWAQGKKSMSSWFAASCVSGLIVLDKADDD